MDDIVIKKMKVDDLDVAKYNPRTISPEALRGLNSSIERFGLVQPIVWNERTGTIVGGHQRLKVLKKLGAEDTEVIVVDFPIDEEIALNITLNNPSIQGTFTEDAIAILDAISAKDEFELLKLDVLRDDLSDEFEKRAASIAENVGKKTTSVEATGVKCEHLPSDQVMIKCPRCSSEFRKSDKKVFHLGDL